MKNTTTTKKHNRRHFALPALLLAAAISIASFGTSSIGAEAATTWSNYPNDYASELEAAKITYYNELLYNSEIVDYILFDIDGNGIPELIYRTGDCEANYLYHVVTYNNGYCYCGSFTGSHATLFDLSPNEACGLALGNGYQGYVSLYQLFMQPDYSSTSPSYYLTYSVQYENRYMTDTSDPFGFGSSYVQTLYLHSSYDTTYLNQVFQQYGVY